MFFFDRLRLKSEDDLSEKLRECRRELDRVREESQSGMLT